MTVYNMQTIEKEYQMVDCFEVMLNHWVGRSSPPPSWSAVIRALESPAIARGDIATKIKVGHELAVQACSTSSIILTWYTSNI